MTTQQLKRDELQIRFARLAWLSMCLSILTGIAHVRAFPSYNAATALVAIYASQDDSSNTDLVLRKNAMVGIMCALTTLADFIFCAIWAGEIALGYNGLEKASLIAFILNTLIKGALIHSAMLNWLAASSNSSKENSSEERGDEETTPPKRRSLVNDTFPSAQTPIRSHPALTPGSDVDEHFKGIPGLVSPGFDPRDRVQ